MRLNFLVVKKKVKEVSKIKLDKKLLLGVATAATQIEGGDYQNNWYQWGEMGNIKAGGSSIVACDHWNRYIEDTDIMDELGIETYRFSIEWSRIEPFEGQFNEEGIKHYQDEVDYLLSKGIIPLVTLHHFSSPIWIQDIGGWKNKKTVDYFVRFVEKVVLALGNRVSEYCVINEPNVFVNDTYLEGKYPGGERNNVFSYFKASKNLIKAHVRVYDLIHTIREENKFLGETKVGVAHHFAHFELNTKNPLFKITKRFIDHSFHGLFLKGMIEGKLSFPFFPKRLGKKKRYSDFIGVNYYTRSMITPSLDFTTLFGEVHYKENLEDSVRTDLDWEVFPRGLYHVIDRVYRKYKLPIYITENGIADKEDRLREDFIRKHLIEVNNLIDSGVDVKRYYYWSLLDNLEWDDGYGPRFGLVHVNYETQERTIRKSGRMYQEIIKSRCVDSNENTNQER